MNRLEYLSQFSNAVLVPELRLLQAMGGKRNRCGRSFNAGGAVNKSEMKHRKTWCEKQLKEIGQFGAVLEKGFKA